MCFSFELCGFVSRELEVVCIVFVPKDSHE